MQISLRSLKKFPVISVVICLLCFALYLFNSLTFIDNSIYDYLIVFKQEKNKFSDICIIGIGPKSLEKMPNWPWNRSVYTDLIKKIAPQKPYAIAFNLIFDSSKEGDDKFIEGLKMHKGIFLGFSKDGNDLLLPHKKFLPYVKPADVNIFQDTDGIVRKFRNNSLYHKDYKSLAASIAEFTDPAVVNNDSLFWINYSIPTANFKHYEFYDVLTNKKITEEFQGKIVLVGLTSENMAHNHNIPLSNKTERSISGVELQAHILNSILNRDYIKEISSFWLFIFLIVISILLESIIKPKNPLTQVITTLFFLIILFIICYTVLKYLNIWIPPAVLLVAVVLISFTFSIKSLLKIEKTVKKTISELSADNYIPLETISEQVEKEVITLSRLSQVISKDRQLIKAILDAINSPVFVIDNDSRIIWKNKLAEQMKSISESESLAMMGIDITDLKNIVQQKSLFRKEISVDQKDFIFVATPSGDTNNPYVCILNDITELKNLDRLKTELLRTVSHEIRTPLTVIQSYCDLAEEMEDGDVALKYMSKISDKTEELTELVSDFLDLNKLEANMVELNYSDVTIDSFIEVIISELRELADSKSQKIEFVNRIAQPVSISADRIRLKQVIINLLSNAIKYSPENTVTKVIIDKENSNIKISIEDQGFGIAEQDCQKIFDKFYRVQNEKTESIGGTGLGLAIAKKIIEMHKGAITVTSKVGSGSKFEIIF